nr:SusC/RagA family TonB-linked outer membrane protein [uncultured Bacteroides sp.]
MNKYKYIILILFMFLGTISVVAQNLIKLEGTVVDPYNNAPIEGAVISLSGQSGSVKTDAKGYFQVEVKSLKGEISVWYPGYYTNVQPIANRKKIRFVMVSQDKYGYSENMILPLKGITEFRNKQTNLNTISKNGINLNKVDLDQSLMNIPGLQLIGKGGMPGEGNYFSIRGANTVTANSMPLIVINGVPYMPDMNESGIIGGHSRNILGVMNAHDIQNITVLKGADAALYGSLGSNGVIMIETDKAVDLDTKVEFIGQYGFEKNQSTFPVMGVNDYKSYISNVALTKYSDMADVLTQFPYLIDDPTFYYKYKYNNNTNWQNEIYSPGFFADNVLKIKGGDAIAKYDISLGYQNKSGQLKGANFSKFYTRLNADVNLNKKLSMFSTVSMAYINSQMQEQGMIEETNPLLTALKKAPLLSPYEKDADNNLLPDLAIIRNADGNLIENNMVSNPLAVVSNVKMKEHLYDVQMNVGLNYKLTDAFSLKGIVGLYYNRGYQSTFIPGVSDQTIMPLEDQIAENTIRAGQTETFNTYFNLNANYAKTFNKVHAFKASVGVQVAMNKSECDAGKGVNSSSDFYKTLNYVSTTGGRSFYGYNDLWNWLNYNYSTQYTYNNQIAAGINLSMDASSSIGPDASRYHLYPAFNVAWYAKNSLFKDVEILNNLTLRAEYVTTGNSRFSSSLSKYNYLNKVFRQLSGLTRAGIPNTNIVPELNRTFGLGADLSLWNHRIDMTLDYYNTKNSNLIMPRSISSAFGVDYLYDNVATAKNTGFEAGLQLAVVQTKNWKWYVGGTVSFNKNEITDLDGENSLVLNMADGSAVVSEVGSPLYSFYGYKTAGVFSTAKEAQTAGKNGASLTNIAGKAFGAGDIHFVDQNNDGIIDDRDRVNLGSAAPDFYGNFFTNLQYKGFELSATFGYSKGNKMYNAVRQSMESMKDFTNQLISVNNRWTTEGQVTNMPKAIYGDPMGNARFSDRWIEDASFIKLKELMLSYKFKYLGGTTVFVSGENLFTITDYLGLDPETMYSYDSSMRGFDYGKIALPRSIKFGFKLQF